MNKNILFKQNGDAYDMYYIDKEGEHDMGVNFAIPEGTKIEDYPIKIEEFDSSGKRKLRPCQNLKVILANPPKETEVVIFSIDAGVVSNTDTALKIERELIVRNNNNMELTLPEVKGAKPYLTFFKLNIESNKDSALSFSRLSSKNGESILSKENFISLRTQTSTYSGNSNINFVVHSGFVNFDILSNKGESNKERTSVICDALVSNCFNNDIKATYNLGAGGYQETITLTLDSDIVNAGGTKYELSCPTKIVCKDKTIKENKESSILYIDGRTKIIGQGSAAFLTVTSKNFNITRGSTITINGFNFINIGEGTVNLSDTNVLSNSTICTYDKRANLNLSDARLSGSAINFTQSDDHVYKIKTLIANNSNIDNAAGTFSGTIENAKVDYLTFKPGSSLYLNMRDRDYKDTHYEVKNLTLEDGAKFLMVPTYGFNDNEKEPITDKVCSLENVVAQGDSEITGYVHFDMFNSVVSNFRGSFSRESYRTNLSNSMFSGECNISGVKSIDTSSVENSSIRGNNVEIKNEMIKNLTNYSGAQRESNENAGLANTKEIEIL
jgi:hypothetical protein